MPRGDLTVIFVSYNSAQVITERHDALCAASQTPVIIVDNASPDGSANALAERYPDTTVLPQDRNLGYGRGANVALRACTTPYALLLNPDLHADPADIDRLLAHLQAAGDRVALSGPAVLDEQHRPDAEPAAVDWISGCAILFNVAVTHEIGLFDERIFLYSEETELCQRVRAAGYTILRCDDVHFDHDAGTSSGSSPALDYLRGWHFAWSNAYRMTKHRQTTLWKHPRRKMISCRLHALLTRKPHKRTKWGAKADGYAAFLRGEQAFDADGHPMMAPKPQPLKSATAES
ncbi:MAG: glycosyltransferase family 2 protein [Planctomycetota bacterium]